jgi:hypothetical protein
MGGYSTFCFSLSHENVFFETNPLNEKKATLLFVHIALKNTINLMA